MQNMTAAAIHKKISDLPLARWGVLTLVSFTMLTSYIVIDVMAPLKTMLEQQLGWNSADYGIFTSGYGLFNIFLLMLIFGGMVLDKMGARFTGILSFGVMILGAAIKYFAISSAADGSVLTPSLFGWEIFSIKKQVFYATLGFAIFGVGAEMVGITANKIVVKWFEGRSLALALGLNVAAGRLGTAIAFFGAYPYAKAMNSAAAPILLCIVMLLIGLAAFLIFGVMDKKLDKESENAEGVSPDAKAAEEFKFSDIFRIARIKAFWYLALLCLLFYSAVFPFLKFATELMIQKFHLSTDYAGLIPALLPFGNILLTPFFGSIYDRKGYGATIMVVGSVMLIVVHILFAIPALTAGWLAIVLMLVLGAAFSLVPSAMWPSLTKIVPYRMLGTSYSMVFWIQNWGLAGVPLLVGYVLNKYCVTGQIVIDGETASSYDYTLPMMIFAGLGILSVVFALLLKREDAKKHYGLELPNIQKQ